MPKKIILTGILFALLSVIIGAFGAHGLQKYVDAGSITPKQIQDWETGARYQMYHAFALIACGLIAGITGPSKKIVWSFRFFVTGIIFFSGSLYLIAVKTAFGLGELHWIWPFTPLGGLMFMMGWILLGLSILSHKNK